MARSTSALMMSMGTVNVWGFSPSFDLSVKYPGKEVTSYFLAGAADIRHVLHTLANRAQCSIENGSQHFYILEHAVEPLARHLLLLQVALDTEVPLRQRCNLFLEIFGNARIQERTAEYIEKQAKKLTEFVHNERGSLASIVDLSCLKMRTRDELVDVFNSWSRKSAFEVESLRDHRLRHYYDTRYDYRDNVIDWDYTMVLKKIDNASVIHIKQFREWRNSGIAFEFGDQVYSQPNRTMASYTEATKKRQGSVLCRGLWTDIVVSPYISFGVDTDRSNGKDAEQLFEVHNKGSGVEQNRHNTVEVSVYNVLSWLYALETGHKYEMSKDHDIYSGLGDGEQATLPRVVELSEDEDNELPEDNEGAPEKLARMLTSLQNTKIIPLLGKVEDLYGKKRYRHLFDHAFISTQYAHAIKGNPETDERGDFTSLLNDSSIVSVESSTFLLPLSDDQRVAYLDKLMEMANAVDLKTAFTWKTNQASKQDLLDIQKAILPFEFHRSEHGAAVVE